MKYVIYSGYKDNAFGYDAFEPFEHLELKTTNYSEAIHFLEKHIKYKEELVNLNEEIQLKAFCELKGELIDEFYHTIYTVFTVPIK